MQIWKIWTRLRSSLWFVPGLITVGAVILAMALIEIDAHVPASIIERYPRLFGAGAEGSRGLLSAVASSMITVAGVVFSITIVALSLASSQYTSRILLNFMRDRMNQLVLGVFVGIFAYCLMVLRTIRGEPNPFVPALAVAFGFVLALVGIGFLIYFIHHIAASIQVSSILGAIHRETLDAIDRLFPEELAESEVLSQEAEPLAPSIAWKAMYCSCTGYIQSVDFQRLFQLAREEQLVIRMDRGVGDFVAESTRLGWIEACGQAREELSSKLEACYSIGKQRTIEQDPGFGIRQIVDIALKALSPGVNDTTTAIMCVDYFTAILVRLAGRDIPSSQRCEEGQLRVVACGPSFKSLVDSAFQQIRQNAAGNVAVLRKLLNALEILAPFTKSLERREILKNHWQDLCEAIDHTVEGLADRDSLKRRAERVGEGLTMSFE